MELTVFLPVAGNAVNVFVLVGLGAGVGFLSGMFGVGGGFLMTPLLIMIGVPPVVAAGSDSNQIVAASTSGTYAHARAGSVDFKMGVLLFSGGIAGGTVGVYLVRFLRELGEADFVIQVTYVVMLGAIGAYMFVESLQGLRGRRERTPRGGEASAWSRFAAALPGRTEFPRSGIALSPVMPFALGAFVGVLAAIMGVGGGFIMIPVMVYLLRMPMHVVVGTSLFQILFTCIHVTILQATLNRSVDVVLALLLLVGSVVGAQLGARVSRRLNADQLKIFMAVVVLAVMVKMLVGLVVTPSSLVSYAGGHS